ncbi:MAG TPA: CehA/McbA family metallohydrolase, partial [Candidatus Hydrogenedentes bacterium]|nr:CehA/McbA family metallohydrolase [Candidatus Hydrogenedentota bacterium]
MNFHSNFHRFVCGVFVWCIIWWGTAQAQRLPDAWSTAAYSDGQASKAGVQYNIYFGNLHNHSSLSDGDGDPDEAYAHARDVAHLDFFGLSDHAENLWIWPWEHKWETLKDTAQAYYAPGEFVTLWGFEWSNPLMGHICVHNTDENTNTVSDVALESFFDWIKDHPEGFAVFNHPGRQDSVGTEFNHFDLDSDVYEQMVGIETFNKGDGFDEYHYVNAYDSGMTYLDLANTKGWRAGATGGFDHHGTTWGSSTSFRTGVLATELTREAIVDAYRNRRFYSTENQDLYVDFRCSGYPMGSQLTGVPLRFTVSAWDGSGDLIQEVRLYRNGINLDTKLANSSEVMVSFEDPSPNPQNYYYVVVGLNVGDHGGHPDEAITSPIWCNACEAPEGEWEGEGEGGGEGEGEGEGEDEFPCITPCTMICGSNGIAAGVADALTAVYGTASLALDPNTHDGDGNGMVDLAQCQLLDLILSNPSMDPYCCILAAWNVNYALVNAGLDLVAPEVFTQTGVSRAACQAFFTGFFTLGESQSQAFLLNLMNFFTVNIDFQAVDSSAAIYLAGRGDADLDFVCNLSEYWSVVQGPQDFFGFILAAIDPSVHVDSGQCSSPCYEIPEGEGGEEGNLEGQVEGVIEGEGTEEGMIEGQLEGVEEGLAEGQFEGVEEGVVEGQTEGAMEGEGVEEGVAEGQLEGALEGIIEGQAEGIVEGEGFEEGQFEGVLEGIIEGQAEGEGFEEGVLEGQLEGVIEGVVEGQTEGMAEGGGLEEGVLEGQLQ